jgi:hypothetical protein
MKPPIRPSITINRFMTCPFMSPISMREILQLAPTTRALMPMRLKQNLQCNQKTLISGLLPSRAGAFPDIQPGVGTTNRAMHISPN